MVMAKDTPVFVASSFGNMRLEEIKNRIYTTEIFNILAVVSTGMIMTGMMSVWGYPSAVLPQLSAPDSPIHFTSDQASWFATVTLMMCIPGSFTGGVLSEHVGPRKTILLLSPILALAMSIMALGSCQFLQDGAAEIMLLASRVVQGTVVALLNPIIVIYAYEVCAARNRGTSTCIVDVCGAVGFLLSYGAGCSFHWTTVAWLLPVATILPGYIGVLISSESPMWLARHGRETEARKAMILLRSSEQEVSEELKVIMESNDTKPTCLQGLQTAARKPNRLPVLVSCTALILKELTGITIIVIYVVEIFHLAGVGLSPCWSSIVVGIVRVICGFTVTILVHKLPKKPILLVGNILLAVANTSLGIFFFLQSQGEDVLWLSWLPLLAFVIHTVGYTGATGPVSWSLSIEMLPGCVRSTGFTIGYTCYSLFCFVLTKTFTDLKKWLGLHVIFWFYAGSCVLYTVMAILYIPETRGHSLREIEEYWENKYNKKQQQQLKIDLTLANGCSADPCLPVH